MKFKVIAVEEYPAYATVTVRLREVDKRTPFRSMLTLNLPIEELPFYVVRQELTLPLPGVAEGA